MIYLILILSLMANALANVFIKAGMKDYKGGINISFISHMLKTPNVIIGLLFFALAFIGYSFVYIPYVKDPECYYRTPVLCPGIYRL